MIRINLLPHRAEKRRARYIQFVALSVISVVLGGLLVGSVLLAINTQIDYQERRNEYLKAETLILDKQIEEINQLREQTRSLLARKSVVEGLQSTRSDVVHLLDQMLRILPEGIYLKSLKQTSNRINLIGYAQSNARVSTLMRAIEDSKWLDTPMLIEIHAVTIAGGRVNEFSLNFNLTQMQTEKESNSKKPGNKPAEVKG